MTVAMHGADDADDGAGGHCEGSVFESSVREGSTV